MNTDDERSDGAAANRVGATIRMWRAPNRIWPGFPTLVVTRAASRLARGGGQRRRPEVGEGGVVGVFVDGSNVGTIAPQEIKVYHVSPGDHSLSLHFLGGLRRSRKLSVPLAEGEEKQFVCVLNAFAWPSVRLATPDDFASMDGSQSPLGDAPEREADAT